MPASISQVIGEGTYGCVHEPSLTCADKKDIDYKGKVSKFLQNKYARAELDEYLGIQRVDPKALFFLGVPIHCKPEQSTSNYIAAKKCKLGQTAVNERYGTIDPAYDLLIMKDGGLNLKDFAKNMEHRPATKENQKIMEKFWIECHRLFLGLSVFLQENIMHHDLKAQNIVYNPETNRIAFIDFGLMRPLTYEKSRILRGNLADNLIHWSYPVETMFYASPYNFSKKGRDDLIEKLDKNLDKIFHPAFLGNVLPETAGREARSNAIDFLYFEFIGLTEALPKMKYKDFLNKSLSTFDLYGVCMGLLYVWNKTHHIMNSEDSKVNYHSLFTLLFLCITPDVSKRITVDEMLDNYERQILSDILREDHIIFVDHIPTKIEPPPHLRVPKLSDAALENMIEKKDAKLLDKVCPPGKILNPLTGRCVLECKEGKQRDEKFRCKTVKQNKTAKRERRKPLYEVVCPDDKERNPNTNRCVAKCKDGYRRDEEFKCKSMKRRKKEKIE